MHWLEAGHLQAAALCLVLSAALGWFAPALVARLPEPRKEPHSEPQKEPHHLNQAESDPAPEPEVVIDVEAVADGAERRLFARTLPPAPDKELYVTIAALPHLSWWVAACSALVGAAFGLALGWTGALLYLVPLVPIGVVLVIIDWRTTLLPTRILHPTYGLLAVLIPFAALVDRDLDSLYRAGWGWLLVGGWFWIFWWLVTAWGFGDVRLARVLGPALGYLGWPELVMGLVLMLLIGAFGGLAVAVARGSLRARVPYGPSMLLGAGIAVVAGPWLAQSLGY